MKACGSKGVDLFGNKGCGCLILAFRMECPECGYLFPAKEALKHIGELKLLMCDERLALYEEYQADLRKHFACGWRLTAASEAYSFRHGEPPDPDWSFAALFGDSPTMGDALRLQQYCRKIDSDEPMVAEFGWDWEERLKRVQWEAMQRKNVPK